MIDLDRFQDFSHSETIALYIVSLVSGILSLIGSLVLFVSIFVLRKYNSPFWRAIATLCFYDFVTAFIISIGSVVGLSYNEISSGICTFQGVLFSIFLNGSIFNTLLISIILFLMVIGKINLRWWVEVLLHTYPLPVIIVVSFIPFYSSANYTDSGAWCWLSVDPVWARYVGVYVWTWIVMIMIIALYFTMGFYIRYLDKKAAISEVKFSDLAQGKKVDQQKKNRITRDLFVYSMAFILLWIPNSINRIIQATGSSVYFLMVLECFCLPLQGFVDAVVFGVSTGAYKMMADRVVKSGKRENEPPDSTRHRPEAIHLLSESDPDYASGHNSTPLTSSINSW